MKKIFLSIAICALTIFGLYAQRDGDQFVSTTPTNKNVILEEYTGINCTYCPDGHRIANEIAAANPGRVFPINIHVGSYAANTYTTQFGTALMNQSGLEGFPSGTINRHVFSGSVTALNRNNWASCSNTIMSQTSPVNIAARGTLDWTTRELNITVQLYYTANEANSTNKLNVAIIQDNVLGTQIGGSTYNPAQVVGSQYRHMHMLRHLITGQWGEDITTTTQGSFVEKTYTYTIPETLGSPNAITAKLEDLSFIAFVAQGQQEILTGCEVEIENINMPALAARVDGINNIQIDDCSNDAMVNVMVTNTGSGPITSLTFEYNVANGTPMTYNWTGNIASIANETIDLPIFSINTNTNQVVTVKIVNANGQTFVSNEMSLTINKAVVTGATPMTLKIKTDGYASETSFKLYNSSNSIIQQSSSFSNNTEHSFTLDFPAEGCYRLEVLDSYGDGIINGYVRLFNDATQIFNANGSSFTDKLTINIFINQITHNVSVVTNPATDLTESSATLNGAVTMCDGTITNTGFEYRAVGETNFTVINATGATDIFSSSLENLIVNTVYEYRAFVNIAENNETYYGDLQTFEVTWLNLDTIYIYDAEMLQWVSNRCNSGATFEGKYIKLMNNIVLALNQPNNMTSIGIYPSYPFKGTFDGNGLVIKNLYIDHPNTEYQGFFGYTLNANLYDVGLENITASGRNYTGGMVAYAQNTHMRDCYVNGGTLYALSYCGGLVGYQQNGTNSIISGCYNTCTVSGNHYVGGLVGFSNYATVRNSYVAASVTGQGNAIGAIIGGANEVLMYNCYFSSTITGQTNAIGENNFKDGEGMTDEAMRDPAFVATLNQGLEIPVWKSDYEIPINNGFPILIWQYSNGEACESPENLTATFSGDSLLLNWTGGNNANYFIVEYGILGETPQQESTSNRQFTIHNVQEGTYFWRVKSVCSFGESNFVNGENIITGIPSYDGTDIALYPNPTTGIVNVQCTMNNAQLGNGEIQVFDVYGRLLNVVAVSDTRSVSAQTTEIDLSHYANGIYIIKWVNDNKAIAMGKVVKQ